MAFTLDNGMPLLGLIVTGDLGPWTCYTDESHQVTWFPRSPPDKPPSPGQITQRDRFKTAMLNWNDLDPSTKAEWTLATRRASLAVGPANAYLRYALRPDGAGLQTLRNQTQTVLPTPEYVP